jgi:hypothetical protein
MQDSKKLVIKKMGDPGTVAVDLLPWDSAADVLHKSGAGADFMLSPAPQMGIVYDADEEVWNWVMEGQALYVVRSSYPG